MSWTHVWMLAPPAVGGILASLLLTRDLNVLALGERGAVSLGVNVQGLKQLALVLAALLAGSAVSVIGMVGFIGLVVPHILRSLLGPDHRLLVPACALGGAAFLAGMDLLQRLVCVQWLREPELRVGALMGLIGGIFFIWLLARQRPRAV